MGSSPKVWLGNLGDWVPTKRLFTGVLNGLRSLSANVLCDQGCLFLDGTLPWRITESLPYNSFPSQFSLTWQVINVHQTTKYLSKSCLLLLTKAHDKQNYLLIVSQFRLHPQIPLLPCPLAMSWRRHSQGGKRVVFSARLAPDDSYAMHSCCDLRVCQISRYLRSSIEGGVGAGRKHACAG